MVSNFRDVIALWKSPTWLAKDIGAGTFAARKWLHRNNIPAEWWSPILRTEVAQRAGLTAETLADLAARERDRAGA